MNTMYKYIVPTNKGRVKGSLHPLLVAGGKTITKDEERMK